LRVSAGAGDGDTVEIVEVAVNHRHLIAVAEGQAASRFIAGVTMQPHTIEDQLRATASGDQVVGNAGAAGARHFHSDETVVIGSGETERGTPIPRSVSPMKR